ncbi:MAG: type IX secretion system sortase PorU, partial [Fluviicola sp.]|nr:type IX secretion system sortase PorU [Fluviicola sp.]
QATDTLRDFFAFSSADYKSPSVIGRVTNQNLHGLAQADYVIVTHPSFIAQAQRLGDLHSANGTSTHVVTTSDIYNEFSSGAQDATAIKRFMKMFYDRANGNPVTQPKNLLLFGDVTYDPKNRVANNNYYVPTYEFVYSEDHINAMVTDDFFGILNNTGGMSPNDLMQIGVGRLLISNNDQAVEQVNKIEHYMKNGSQMYTGGANACCSNEDGSTFGDYRLNYTLITDDDDDNEEGYFIVKDAEPAYDSIKLHHPEMNVTKIYCDANVQSAGAGGERYPEVFNQITDKVETGSLVVNYIGHGGEVGAAKERIITIPQIQSWTNINKMGLFVTATCEFTKFDDPARVSAGEWISLNAVGGSIALMTTTRSVYFNVNTNIVKRLYAYVFDRDANGEPLTFGEIMRLTKNTSGSNDNRRSFNLIGDPNLKIAIPRYKIVTDSINHLDPDLVIDTVEALSKMHLVGHLEDFNGNILTNFDGVLKPTIYDKIKISQTLQNEPSAPLVNFEEQKSALYKGKVSVKNGYFKFEFIVPKDINYNYGKGKISYYANSTSTDAAGFDTLFVVGGLNTAAAIDNEGPEVAVYLNDKNFVNGGITSSSPLLIVETNDEYGINTVGNGVGHDLTLIIDGNTANPIVLNQYYSADLDQYQSGSIQYTMRNLAAGEHTLEVKIWDVNNNSSVSKLDFTVKDPTELAIDHVLNYPNPFTTKTSFYFEHNQSCSSLNAQIQIYTVSGRLVKTINKEVPTAGFRVEGIDWDGTDDFGDQLAKGVYVYRVSVELPEGGKAEKMEKLVLLR